MNWKMIDGHDFNIDVVSGFSLEDFKKEYQYSYCEGRSEKQIETTFNLLKKAAAGKEEAEPVAEAIAKTEADGNSGNVKKKNT